MPNFQHLDAAAKPGGASREYRLLGEQMAMAVSSGRADEFIAQLERRLQARPTDYLAGLFLARTYGAIDNATRASLAYSRLLSSARSDHPNYPRLLNEVELYARRVGDATLLGQLGKRMAASGARRPSRAAPAPKAKEAPDSDADRITRLATPALEGGSSVEVASYAEDEDDLSPAMQARDDGGASPKRVVLTVEEWGLDRSTLEVRDTDVEAPPITLTIHEWGLGHGYRGLTPRLPGPVRRPPPRPRPSPESDLATINRSLADATLSGDEALTARLLNQKAQLLSGLEQWPQAAAAYEALLQMAHLGSHLRRNIRMQVARIYAHLGDVEQAKRITDQVLAQEPQDAMALRMRETLEKVADLEIDMPDQGVELVSPMLRRDLETATFRDQHILSKLGRLDVGDARYLLRLAEDDAADVSAEPYPLYLEAAKAYSGLPSGSYPLNEFHRALGRYAMLKGGALVGEMRRLLTQQPGRGPVVLHALRRLRDSATSYSLEALRLQVDNANENISVSLTNHLRAQLACVFAERGMLPSDIFNGRIADLLRTCIYSDRDDIASIAFESLVAWGAASGRGWSRVKSLLPVSLLGSALREPESRTRSYQRLAAATGISLPANCSAKEALRLSFLERRGEQERLHRFFDTLPTLTTLKLRAVHDRWRSLMPRRGALLDTDLDTWAAMTDILEKLQPYSMRTPEERTAMLFQARTSVEVCLDFLQENPTHWGRVGLEPTLRSWQASIRAIEQQRLKDLAPRLQVVLEPPVFHLIRDAIQGGLSVQNSGKRAAERVTIQWSVLPLDTEGIIFRRTEVLPEIKASSTTHTTLRIPLQVLRGALRETYTMEVKAMIDGGVEPAAEARFTLEIDRDDRRPITSDEIPWQPLVFPGEDLFKGREALIKKLVDHLCSDERKWTYMLYGLTRTGKSSILGYLGRSLDFQSLAMNGAEFRFVTFAWDFAIANANSSVSELWKYLVGQAVYGKLDSLRALGQLTAEDVPPRAPRGDVCFRDWGATLEHLRARRLFPVFLVDEFSYYGRMVPRGLLDSSFLAAIRHYTFEDYASFVFAGTYDILQLVNDPAYGITGQLANMISMRVSRIERTPAVELIRVMEPRLVFTNEAIEHVLRLSHCIPHFIQLVCRACALFAVSSGRGVIGFPEVEQVVHVLIGKAENQPEIRGVDRLSSGSFSHNMYFPQDPKAHHVLISAICSLRSSEIVPSATSYPEIKEVWERHGARLASLYDALTALCEREILVKEDDEGVPAYRISVDLFRRWWTNEHRYLDEEFDAMREQGP
ncbi:tetratricopeptide repeat protein [Sorangium sp. So ce854]|uniref:tetratricopeptide repeat protein n=1 Tax=Sorangium sp. So ce854 TaxID=3133322 RepID=UPI003F5F8379